MLTLLEISEVCVILNSRNSHSNKPGESKNPRNEFYPTKLIDRFKALKMQFDVCRIHLCKVIDFTFHKFIFHFACSEMFSKYKFLNVAELTHN